MARRRRATSPTRSRPGSGRGIRSTAWRSWSGPVSRPASSRNASSPSASPTGWSAAPASMSARRSGDAVAYLRVIAQPDDDLAFERIINLPRRGIGNATLQLLHQAARAQGVSLTRATAMLLETDELRPAVRKSLGGLMEDFRRWRAMLDGIPHAEVAATALDESGYTEMWQKDKSPDAPGRLENLKELVSRPGGVRYAAGLPRAYQPGDGERRRRDRRAGQPDDPARRQGTGVRHRLPARLGRRASFLTSGPSTRAAPPGWRRSAASPMWGSPGPSGGR